MIIMKLFPFASLFMCVSSYNLLQNGRIKLYKELSGYNKQTGEVDHITYYHIVQTIYI